MLRVLLLAFVALLACAGSAAAASSPAKQLDNALDRLVAGPGGPPGAISIVQRGATRTVHRAGVAKRGRRAPIRSIDHMRLASTSKAFNGAVALSLVDKGVLSLDDTIAQRLPALPAAWGPVTLRQLLNHTSGLPDYLARPRRSRRLLSNASQEVPVLPHATLLDFVGDKDARVHAGLASTSTRTPTTSSIAHDGSRRRPASSYRPALALDRCSGRSGLDRDLPARAASACRGRYAHGYVVDPPDPPDGRQHARSARRGAWASGGMLSRLPTDLNRVHPRLPRQASSSVSATQRRQLRFVKGHSEPPGPGANRAGLGIFRYRTRCGTVFGHTGNFPGYTQFTAATPDGERSVTFSISEQLTQDMTGRQLTVFKALRRAEETAVCAALD